MKTTFIDSNPVREGVRSTYGKIALYQQNGCCASEATACRGTNRPAADKLGYGAEEIAALPEGADLGLGCGNPQAIASLKPGETVLDLGSGAGFDCFLAARTVGPTGRVLGVDMTPEMLAKARADAAKSGVSNVDFRLGEIESLPISDNGVDVIISNCVINLSPDKPRVFREALRALKPGGRLAIADIVRSAELPPELSGDLAAHCGCVAGAASVNELEIMLHEAGFSDLPAGVQLSSASGVDYTVKLRSQFLQCRPSPPRCPPIGWRLVRKLNCAGTRKPT